jgi:hypothetical protein
VGDASFTAGDTCHELTGASYEETSPPFDVGDESLRAGNDPSGARVEQVRAGVVSLSVRGAFHARRAASLLETCIIVSAGGARRSPWLPTPPVPRTQPGVMVGGKVEIDTEIVAIKAKV